MFDPDHSVPLLLELLAVPGTSGDEQGIHAQITKKLLDVGVPHSAIIDDKANKRIPSGGSVGNLVVRLCGNAPGAPRLLVAHLDTVPLCRGARPVVVGNEIHSADPDTALGGDNRTGCAALVLIAEQLLRLKGNHPPVTLLFTVQEELGNLGAQYLDHSCLGDVQFALNFDGAKPEEILRGAIGTERIQTRVCGRAAHAGVSPEAGVSAIAVAATAIANLVQQGSHGLILRRGMRGTLNVGVVRGGEATNVVCPEVITDGEVRSLVPGLRRELLEEYRAAFAAACEAVWAADGGRALVEHQVSLLYEAFEIPENSPLLELVRSEVTKAGRIPEVKISNGGLDANWLAAHGVPTITIGAGQRGIHSPDEKVIISDFLAALDVGFGVATGSV